MSKQLHLSLVIISAVVLVGCANTPSYHATALSKSDGAVVRGYWSWASWHPYVFIDKVDGRETSRRTPHGPILVDAGVRNLTVSATHFDRLGHAELQARLQAGHAYQVQLEQNGKLMTFWVEDVKTHETVSERQSTNSTYKSGVLQLPAFHF